MNFHEYQAKELFAQYGITVPPGKVANSPDAAVDAAKALGGSQWMVKAQIHAGGRGKAGGVKFCKSLDDVRAAAKGMLGTNMATYQSAGRALPVNLVLVTDATNIAKELYLSVLVDRDSKSVSFIASKHGGVDIEQVARDTPEDIHTIVVDFVEGLQPYQCRNLGFAMVPGSGNADLYVRFGAAPTDSAYDCRPYRAGSRESCAFVTPQAGTWYVHIKARTGFSGVSLTGSYTAGGGGGGGGTQTYNSGGALAIPDNGSVDSPIAVSGRSGNAPSAASVSVNITHPRRGDLRIRLVAPDGSAYLLKAPSATDAAANVVATYPVNLSSEPLNGTWKLRVVDTATGNVGTLNAWSITF